MIKKIIILSCVVYQFVWAKLDLMSKLELTNNSNAIRILSNGNIIGSLDFENEIMIFNLNHPFDHFVWYKYSKMI